MSARLKFSWENDPELKLTDPCIEAINKWISDEASKLEEKFVNEIFGALMKASEENRVVIDVQTQTKPSEWNKDFFNGIEVPRISPGLREELDEQRVQNLIDENFIRYLRNEIKEFAEEVDYFYLDEIKSDLSELVSIIENFERERNKKDV